MDGRLPIPGTYASVDCVSGRVYGPQRAMPVNSRGLVAMRACSAKKEILRLSLLECWAKWRARHGVAATVNDNFDEGFAEF